MLPLIHALLLAFSTNSAREGVEYTLLSSDGRYLVADPSRGRMLLVAPVDAALPDFCKFTFVRVDGSKTLVYLRFGDVLLHAPTNSADDHDEAAQFQVFARPSDGKVALASLTGTLLRAARYSVEQGGVPSEDAVWWTLRTAPDARADCPGQGRCSGALPGPSASASGETRRLRGGGSKRSAKDKGAVVHRTTKTTPRAVYAASTAMVLASTAAMLPTNALAPLASIVPSGLVSLITSLASRTGPLSGLFGAIGGAFTRHGAMVMVLLHGLLTDGISDALAQAVSVQTASTSSTTTTSTASQLQTTNQLAAPMSLDWGRLARSTTVSFVTDDIPFALWAKFLWEAFEKLRPVILGATVLPMWMRLALTSPLGIASLKTLASQAAYETTSTAAYLGLQEVMRGGGPKQIFKELKSKFWRAYRSGLAFFTAQNLLIFLLPVWWLQPIVDNLSCLGFNTYLALLSHEEEEEGAGEKREEEAETADLIAGARREGGQVVANLARDW